MRRISFSSSRPARRSSRTFKTVLPSTPQTAGALSAERLALLPRRAVVVNVGRGTTVDQTALEAALRSGHHQRGGDRRHRPRAPARRLDALGRTEPTVLCLSGAYYPSRP